MKSTLSTRQLIRQLVEQQLKEDSFFPPGHNPSFHENDPEYEKYCEEVEQDFDHLLNGVAGHIAKALKDKLRSEDLVDDWQQGTPTDDVAERLFFEYTDTDDDSPESEALRRLVQARTRNILQELQKDTPTDGEPEPADPQPDATKEEPPTVPQPKPTGNEPRTIKDEPVSSVKAVGEPKKPATDTNDPTAAPVDMGQLKNERIARFIKAVASTSKEDLQFIINDTDPNTKAKAVRLFLKLIGVPAEDVSAILTTQAQTPPPKP